VKVMTTDVCVVGGGPAGRALALALVREGCEVVLLEQHGSGRRAFRGESMAPDAVRLLDRLGVLDGLRPGALRVERLVVVDGGRRVLSVDFDTFDYPYRHPLEIPQPVLLGALARAAAAHGGCTALDRSAAVDLLWEGEAVAGVVAATPGGQVEVRARLTVGADGRFSRVRSLSGLPFRQTPLERDVVWMKLPFPAGECGPAGAGGPAGECGPGAAGAWDRRAYQVRIDGDRHGLFLPSADGLLRVGLNIPKGGFKELRARGIAALHKRLAELAPELAAGAREALTGWYDTALLDIFSVEVPRWHMPGLVLVGDAAHTLSPVLGQGVNHALADAVALAPLAARALRSGSPGDLTAALGAFQRGREGPVRRSRGLQLRQERVFTFSSPLGVAVRRGSYRLMNAVPGVRRRVMEPVYFPGQCRGASLEPPDVPPAADPSHAHPPAAQTRAAADERRAA
jgi:2-polyprenyl-6-methoxyphenol hydroxylase-like FAD-dependent oxidoreductase